MSDRPPRTRTREGESYSFDFAPKAPPAPTPPAPTPPAPEPRIFSVAQLGRAIGRTLERIFVDLLWVEGEVTGARAAPSGHVYLCLKDEEEEASIDVVLYRSALTPRARLLVVDGARLRVRGRPTYWSPRGRLQFQGDRVEPTGKGALLEALERLKAKLAAEGLFERERKRALPHEPRVVGVVTSKAGAAIHDVGTVAFRRGGARILLAPAQVQGAGAAESVRRALRALQRVAEVDVIIVGRGGGSSEDLAAFNDEDLVRDVAACRVPVVSAVGHEVDVTLVDFAADARAATPSQAAEMVVPDAASRARLLEERFHRLRRAMHAHIAEDRVTFERLARAFRDPRLLIASAQQIVDDRAARLGRAMTTRLAGEREIVSRLAARLRTSHPRERIARDAGRVADLRGRLGRAARARIEHDAVAAVRVRARLLEAAKRRLAGDRAGVAELAARLDAMSPLKVLARGYAIAARADDGRAIRDAGEVSVGDRVRVRVATGTFEALVAEVAEKEKKP